MNSKLRLPADLPSHQARELLRSTGTLRFTPPRVWRPDQGVPRAELTVPVAPTGVVSDTVLYEDAVTPTTTFHLPRLRLRTTAASYDISVAALDAGRWSIRVGVDAYPAEELGDAGRASAALPYRLASAAFVYSAPPLSRRVEATEILPDATGFTIGFDLDLPAKDEILWAFKSESGAALVLSRSFTVAVPVAETVTKPIRAFEMVNGGLSILEARAVVTPDVVEPQLFVPIEVVLPPKKPEVEPQPEPEHLELARHVRVPLGLARTFRAGRLTPAEDVQIAPDRIAQLERRADLRERVLSRRRLDPQLIDIVLDPADPVVSPTPTPAQRFRTQASSLEAEVRVRIDPTVHPDIFRGSQASAPSFIPIRLPYPATGAGARSHVYFQDKHRPHVFYHLADEYRLARTESAPLRPAMVFRVEHGEGGEAAAVSLTARLRPHIEPDRLETALVELAALVPPPPGGGEAPAITLEPVQAEAALTLGLPVDAVPVVPPLDLVNGFAVEVQFPFPRFQDIFAALAATDEVGTVLRGTVEVTVGSGTDGPGAGHAFVPVDLRFATAGGDVLAVGESPTADGAVAVTLRNGSESPVRVDAFAVRVSRGGDPVDGLLQGMTLPMELAAGAETSAVVRPAVPLAGDGELDVLIDVTQVVPLPDPQAILALTLDQRVAQMSARTVTVRTTPRKLEGGGDPIDDVFVEFEGGLGSAAHVNADELEATARIPVPLADVLLRRESTPYRFRQTVLRASGETRDTDWRTDDRSFLIVPRD